MTYNEVMKYCLSLNGVKREMVSAKGNAFAFIVDDAVFAYFETGAPIQWRFTLLVTEQDYDELHFPPRILQVSDKPGGPWLMIKRVEAFDEQRLINMIQWAYQKASKLTADCAS